MNSDPDDPGDEPGEPRQSLDLCDRRIAPDRRQCALVVVLERGRLFAGQLRGQLGGDVRAALPGGLCELGERPVPAFAGDVADGEDTVRPMTRR